MNKKEKKVLKKFAEISERFNTDPDVLSHIENLVSKLSPLIKEFKDFADKEGIDGDDIISDYIYYKLTNKIPIHDGPHTILTFILDRLHNYELNKLKVTRTEENETYDIDWYDDYRD